MLQMEVCVDSVTSALNAQAGGASRIELCQGLGMGGLTPSIGLINEVKRAVSIPVYVLIRPRLGDFCYSPSELSVMQADVGSAVVSGVDGIVMGALTKSGDIDVDMCKSLIPFSGGLPLTFHRAFDVCRDSKSALEDIISLGFTRMITSGCQANAHLGVECIKDLIVQANERITIVPAGGINEENIASILKISGAKEFHCSASISIKCHFQNVELQSQFGPSYLESCKERVASILDIATKTVLNS